uniref:Uncharacterized protein n=1 Tax=Phlebotomus papatasi TaxID=29031 RepID=A0A1B0DLU0_PHLPP
MEEIERNVNSMILLVEEHNKKRKEEIANIIESMKKKFLTNIPSQVQAKKKRIHQDDQDKENELSNSLPEANTSKKKHHQEETESIPSQSIRPVRTAKINASKNLKEPDLGSKMRQPLSDEFMVKVKEELLDVHEIKREVRTKKKNKQEQVVQKAPEPEPDTKAPERTSKESEDGEIEVVAPKEAEIVEVMSDGESEKMPPPPLPAPKGRRGRKKKNASTANVSIERPVRESRIKKERSSKKTERLLEVPETSSARSSKKLSGESTYEDALTGQEPMTNADNPNVTKVIRTAEDEPKSTGMDATFDLPKETENGAAEGARNSIMTEDNSFELPKEQEVVKKTTNSSAKALLLKKKTNPHELFNPCVQSPLKTKVEAFERHAAAASALPIATGPSSGLRGKALESERRSRTLGTPNHGPKLMEKSASTSKLAHLINGTKKKSSKGGQAMSATKANTRSASAEDTKRGLNALQLLAEEKRKKREERHKQAQMIREAKEREKEEKHRRMIQEQQEREEKLRQDRIKALKAKQILEQEQKSRLEELQKQQQQKLRAEAKRKASKYGFDMLYSDDSTDDEGKSSDKRPAPPLWSQKPRRKELMTIQETIDAKLLNGLFLARPMTPDLSEIFPDIDPRYLHRNSSVVWKTPPRFSEIPK